MKLNQKDRVLALLKKRRTVRSIDIMRLTWATRPAARIEELREEGHIIETAEHRDEHGFRPYTYKGKRRAARTITK